MQVHQSKPHRPEPWAILAVVLAAAFIAYATLRPAGGAAGTFCVRCGDSWLGDALLNVVLFVPLGLALRATGISTARTMLLSAASSVMIEVLQYTVVTGRFSSVLDVITNSLGGLVGAVGFGIMVRWVAGDVRQPAVAGAFAAAWWVQCLVTAWGLLPWLPTGPGFEGQWAHVMPGFVPFEGLVLDVRLWSIPIPDGPVPDSAAIRSVMADSMLEFAVRTAGLPRAEPVALVAGLANGPTHRVASISLAGCRLQARGGTNSERIGFNTPRIAVENACVDTPGEVSIVVRQDGREFSVSREAHASAGVRSALALRPDIGWVMLAPLITSARKRHLLTLAWIALFAVPVGLFGRRGEREHGRTVAIFAVVMVAGTIVPAVIFHTAFPTTAELLVLVGSLVAGATVASAIPRWPRRATLHLQE